MKKDWFKNLKTKNQIFILVGSLLFATLIMLDIPILCALGLDDFLTYNFIFFAINIWIYILATLPFIYFSILFCKEKFLNGTKNGIIKTIIYFVVAIAVVEVLAILVVCLL